ncbi:MAG: 6-bladed beta-propeller [Candidatus Fermentibacteria bacterium]|nr:6-bladed beta-propeller [Candidatus Fermentibacteria bacterium]
MKTLLIVLFALLLVTGCGTSDPADTSDEQVSSEEMVAEGEYTLPVADNYLHVADSIGIELGDSNFVFGVIIESRFTPEGNIAVLDGQKATVSLFSPAGEFIRSISREGSGPGEFLLPTAMAFFPDGGLIVSDGMGSKLVIFDENYDLIEEVVGFVPSPPIGLVAMDSMEIVGMKPDWEQNEDGMFMGFTVAKWSIDSVDPSVVYYSQMSPFNPADLSSMANDVALFAASDHGRVFTSQMSTEEYSYTAWSAEGEEIFTFTKEDYERVEKTQSEIDLETELVNARMIAQGMPPSMANWEPDTHRAAIGRMAIDDLDRLWVTTGEAGTATFDVFDLDGNLLFTAAIDAGEAAEKWDVIISGENFVSYDMNPEDYPRVFYGTLPGFE